MIRFLSLLALPLAILILTSISPISAQDHFIGQDQPVNRVIRLRSSELKKQVDQKIQAETSRIKSSARMTPALTNPSDVKFDDLNVPKSLQQQPVVNDFSSPPVPTQPARVARTFDSPLTARVEDNRPTERVETKQLTLKASNAIETEIKSPKFVNVNQEAPIHINLRNQGKTSVQNVTLIATIPAHTQLASASPEPIRNDGNTYEFLVSRIGGLETRQVHLTIVPTTKQVIDVATRVRVESAQMTKVAVRQPDITLSISGPQQANIGQKVKHEIIVSNVGDGVATDVRLDTLIPTQLKQLKQDGNSFIRSIEPGKSVKIQYESMAQAPGQVQLKAAATAIGCEDKQASLAMNVYQPELRVSASGPKLNFVERDGIYTINIENTGVVDVTDTRISLRVPEGMKVTTISRQAGIDSEKGILNWNFKRISANSSEQIQLKATALKPGDQVCNILVSSNETRDKEIMLSTQVVTRADLSVSIKNLTGPVQVGGKAEFQVVVENNGTRRASDVSVKIALPESLMPVKTDNEYDSTLLFEEPLVSPGQQVTFKFAAVGVSKGEHVVRSVLRADGSERQVISEDTIFVYEVDQTRVSESISPVVPR